jgi:hypothetical protein
MRNWEHPLRLHNSFVADGKVSGIVVTGGQGCFPQLWTDLAAKPTMASAPKVRSARL